MRCKCGLLLSLLIGCAMLCPAQTAAPAKPAPTPDFSKEAYVVEHLYTTVTVEDDGRNVREVSTEIKILADSGVKAFAVLNFTYASANETVDVDYVRVRKPDGSAVQTPQYNIQDMPADITRTAPIYSDIHEKHVAVRGLGVGDVLEMQIRYHTVTPQIPGQFWYEHSFDTNQIVRDERLEVSLPKGKHVTVKSPDFPPEVKEEGTRKIHRWKFSNLQRKEEDAETQQPKRTTPPPSVRVTTFSNWEEIGRWYSELQSTQVAVTPAIEAKARELTKGLATDDEKLRAIYSYVSLHVHYVGLDFGIGRYQPHAADDVLGNEYGDCKDKHTLLAALLKAAGYDAWPALIHASQKLDPEIPSLAQFNHVITVVPRGKEFVWLDTTPEVAPYGLLMPQLRDKQALVMPTGKSPVLMTTPANPPFPQEQRFTATAKLGPDGVLKGHIVQQYRGDAEVIIRSLLRQLPQAKWQEFVRGFSHGLGFGGEVSNVVVSSVDDLSQPLEIAYDYLRKDYADWEHKQILTLLPPLGIELAGGKDEKPPKEPVFLGALGEIVYHSEIELPPDDSLTPPTDRDMVESYAEYHTRNVLEKGVLKTTRRLVLKRSEVPLAEWESFKKMSKAANDDAFSYLPLWKSNSGDNATSSSPGANANDASAAELIRKGYDASQAGNYDLAITLLKRGVEADPNTRWGWNDLGLAYFSSGQDDLAIEAYEKQITVDPNHIYAYNNLGRVYLRKQDYEQAIKWFKKQIEVNPLDTYAYNNLGLAYLRERNSEEALKWFRKQIEVDPKNFTAALTLAQLLLIEEKFSEAAEVLELAVHASPGNPRLEFILGDAYVKAGEVEEGVLHLRSAATSTLRAQPVDFMQLNNVAYSLAEADSELDLARQCIEQALAELDKQSASPGNRQVTLTLDFGYLWDTAGWIYFKLGDLKRAESYVHASWLLRQNGIVGEHLAEIYEKLGRKEDAVHTYQLAYAAVVAELPTGSSSPVISGDLANNRQAQRKIKQRYERMTGKSVDSVLGVSRLPSGRWPVSPQEELMRMRETKLGTLKGPNESAEFDITFAAGKAPKIEFVSGSEQMRAMTARLAAAKFQVEIPEGSNATLYRRATVHCSQWAPCDAVMAPLQAAPVRVIQ